MPPFVRFVLVTRSVHLFRHGVDELLGGEPVLAAQQGLTLLHFSAQRERFLWDRGCIHGMLRGCLGGVKEF
jgi:hypothetical protein